MLAERSGLTGITTNLLTATLTATSTDTQEAAAHS